MAKFNVFAAQTARMGTLVDNGLNYISELNACIDFRCYYNGEEEKELAEEMLKEQLRKFDVCKMSVSKENLAYIRNMQDKYGIAY